MQTHYFVRYTPFVASPGVIYARNQNGVDWYVMAKSLPNGTTLVFLQGDRVASVGVQADVSPTEKTLEAHFPLMHEAVFEFAPGELATPPSLNDILNLDGTFTTPPPPPRSATKLAMVRAMRTMGLWPTVKAMLAAAPEDLQEDWEMATLVVETDPMFQAFVTSGGFSSTQVDELFSLASGG